MRICQHIAFASILMFTCLAARAESIDNPAYASWSKCNPGTKTVMKSTGGSKDITMTQTLVEVTPEKCVVEMTTDSTISHKMPPMKRDIDRRITDPDEVKKYKEATAHCTDDTITTPAGTFKCKKCEFSLEDTGTMTVWMCDDVPGSNVKSVQTVTALKTTTTMQVTSIEKK